VGSYVGRLSVSSAAQLSVEEPGLLISQAGAKEPGHRSFPFEAAWRSTYPWEVSFSLTLAKLVH